MSKRVARWVATCRGRLSRAAGVRAVPKLEPYAGPSLRWCRRLTPSNFANSMTQFHDSKLGTAANSNFPVHNRGGRPLIMHSYAAMTAAACVRSG
jgi:hypothetical protein